jgi:hypothetical protein
MKPVFNAIDIVAADVAASIVDGPPGLGTRRR